MDDATKWNPGYKYYANTINLIKKNNEVENIYVSSDNPKHDIIQRIIKEFNAKLFNKDEIKTIQFGSTCKYIILSHGSFSAIIGWLGFNSQVYYKKYIKGKIWHGDMFSVNGWNEIP